MNEDPIFLKVYNEKKLNIKKEFKHLHELWTFRDKLEDIDKMKEESIIIKKRINKIFEEIHQFAETTEKMKESKEKLNKIINDIHNY
jgi:hypothetical protein